MNEIEIAKLIISQDGSCDDASCENCPAKKVRQKLGLYSCNDIWEGNKDEYCKKWFENWLKGQGGVMNDKRVVFESEEELLKFINDCIYGKNTEQTIRLAKQLGYILKNPVEEAEEMYNKYNSNSVKDDEEYILIEKLYSAILYLKERQK